MEKIWEIKQKGKLDDIKSVLLRNRGIDEADVAAFLNPDWDRDIHDFNIFKDMKRAVARVYSALEAGEKIVIHGDYDADGVSGTALLYTCLKEICERGKFDFKVGAYLPDREKDGYGVAMHTIERLAEEGTKLLITVDCGIANAKELDRADELGMNVIICDHHQLADELPAKAMIIHPLAPGETYPNKHLCGTGVAFKLASGLIDEARKRGLDFPIGYEKWFLDLVAIATVTDVMPLLGENRTLEKYGLMVLNKTRRQGIRKILELSNTELGSIDTTTIGYRIGPRLNAAGRIASAETAFKTLVAETEEEAEDLAGQLEILNRDRQKISTAGYQEANKMVEGITTPIHVVWNETWNPGIVGLIAGKLVSKFGVPAFALTRSGEHYVGSGRSTGGLHLVEAMKSCGDIFVKAGGHPEACGLTVSSMENLELFKERVTAFADDFFKGGTLKPTIQIEAELDLNLVDWNTHEDIQSFAPFGKGNANPLFVSRNLQIVEARAVGKTQSHLKLIIRPKNGKLWNCIAFGFGDWAEKLSTGDEIDIVYELSVNEWKGNRELQCRVEDLRMSE